MMYTDKAGSLRDSEGHRKVEGMTEDRIYDLLIQCPFVGVDMLRLAKEAIDHGNDWSDGWRKRKGNEITMLLDQLIDDMEEGNDTNV